ncbi:MAG: PfkB family carbohydrate kinase [Gammaproteobacteria bacterium]
MNRILVLGSVACDEVIRLSEPLRVGGHNQGFPEGRRIGGGAANTALALARVGSDVRVISAVGADPLGEWLLESLAREGIGISGIQRSAEVTTQSLVLLDARGERTIVNRCRAAIVPPGPDICEGVALLYVRSADPALAPLLRSCTSRCRVVAHVPPVERGVRPAQVLVGSRDDLDREFLASPWERGREVAGGSLEWVVITSGADGASAYGAEAVYHTPAPTVRAVDTIGAGDVFAAGLIHALAHGKTMPEALEQGVRWGAASVGYEGTVPPPGFPAIDS